MNIAPHQIKIKQSLFSKQLTLKRISVLVVGVLSVLLAGILPFSLYLSNALTFEGARYFGSFMFYAGLTTCLYIGLTTRFRVDWRLRKQALAFGALMFCVVSVFAAIEAPAVNALTPLPTDTGPNGSKAYKFSVPFTEYQWVVAQFRDGTYYAINGSDWNILTIIEPWQPVAPWAALATNKTALTQQVLSVTTAGKVLLNQLTYNYSLTIPANVTVVESYNGLEREFVSSANTQGSPYTISTDTVQSGYYLAQDKAGRYLDEWSSLDYTTVFQTVMDTASANGGGVISLQQATYTTTNTTSIIPKSGVTVEGNDATIIFNNNNVNDAIVFMNIINAEWNNLNLVRTGVTSATMNYINNAGVAWFNSTSVNNEITFNNVNFTCATDNTGGTKNNAIRINEVSKPTFNNCNIAITNGSGTSNFALYIWDYAFPTLNHCNIWNTVWGSSAYGVEVEGPCQPVFNEGTITGGYGGSGIAVRTFDSSYAVFNSVIINGGPNGTFCYGVRADGSSQCTFNNCIINGGSGGTSSYAVYATAAAANKFIGCIIGSNISSARWQFSGTTSPVAFAPPVSASTPYTILSMNVYASSGTATCAVDFGTTSGGTEIATKIPVTAFGYTYTGFTPVEVAAGASMYATANATGSSGKWFVYYTYTTNFASCSAIDLESIGNMTFTDCTIWSNRASNAVRITGNALTNLNWKIENCHIQTLDAANQYAVTATSEITNVPIYNSMLYTNIQNVTMAAGTAQGTNYQP